MEGSIDNLLDRFDREYSDPNSISTGRRKTQRWVLHRLNEAAVGGLVQCTPGELTTYIGSELTRGITPKTALFYLGLVRPFYTWAAQTGVVDPTLALQLKSVSNPRGSMAPNRPKPYTAAQIKEFYVIMAEKYPALPQYGTGKRALLYFLKGKHTRLQRHLWRHARRLQFEAQLALALEEGLRKSEIYNLSIPAMHPDNDQVVVLTAKQEPGAEKVRAVPYAMHARHVVGEWLDFRSLLAPPHDKPWLRLLYPNYNGGVTLAEQIEPLWEGGMASALSCFGSGWCWHRFRHTAATEWLRSGVPLEKLRVFMGHARIEQTLGYAEILDSDVDAAFDSAESDFAHRLGLDLRRGQAA